nr:DNA repair protein RecN [uncultured Porphyromonas sp.]
MITHLHIKDFILIDLLEWDLREGFTSITGETGAGKSIIIGAIELILGGRADIRKMLRPTASKAVVEATFLLEEKIGLRPVFEQNDLDYGSTCILRREILRSGKSRAFVNDTPVSATLLKEIGDHLVDIHSQHHNRLIGDPDFQRSVIDMLSDNSSLRESYTESYTHYRDLSAQLAAEQERVRKEREEEDYITFQYKQLDSAHITMGEEAELRERLAMAEHATEISQLMQELAGLDAYSRDDDTSVLSRIHTLAHDCKGLTDTLPAAGEYGERLEAVYIELKDISNSAARRLDEIEIDPQELAQLQDRMNQLQSLIYKHNVSDGDELIKLRDKYKEQLDSITSAEDRIGELKQKVEKAHQDASDLAEQLTKTREQGVKSFVPSLMDGIDELGIKGASFKVSLTKTKDLTATGQDEVQFLIATNKQTTLLPINEIASGGEISRIMLALKAIIAEHQILPTIIFDEIDTGVSGRAADQLGRIMKRLSRHLQVLSITHLPQIAAQADQQVIVVKEEGKESYNTSLRPVEGEDRVQAIAIMLSGSTQTEAALDNARELLNNHKP